MCFKEGEFDKRLHYIKITYDGGVYRQAGARRGEGDYVQYDVRPEQRINEIKYWKTGEEDAVAQGMTFFVNANGEEGETLELLGDKVPFGGLCIFS